MDSHPCSKFRVSSRPFFLNIIRRKLLFLQFVFGSFSTPVIDLDMKEIAQENHPSPSNL